MTQKMSYSNLIKLVDERVHLVKLFGDGSLMNDTSQLFLGFTKDGIGHDERSLSQRMLMEYIVSHADDKENWERTREHSSLQAQPSQFESLTYSSIGGGEDMSEQEIDKRYITDNKPRQPKEVLAMPSDETLAKAMHIEEEIEVIFAVQNLAPPPTISHAPSVPLIPCQVQAPTATALVQPNRQGLQRKKKQPLAPPVNNCPSAPLSVGRNGASSSIESAYKGLSKQSLLSNRASLKVRPPAPSLPSFTSALKVAGLTSTPEEKTPSTSNLKKFSSPMVCTEKSEFEKKYPELATDERLKNLDHNLLERILSEIVDNSPNVSWNAISGLQQVKKSIKEWVVMPLVRPDLFKGIRAPGKGLLLFGPPGTGKTLIGKCIASESKATFFSISASVLTSKWVGEGEKMVRALFAVARAKQPSVIFIDEIDSLLTQRNDSDHESSRRMKTEFLLQFDGLGSQDEEKLLVVGATNRPSGLDEAARRRFTKKLYVALPLEDARKQMIENSISKTKHNLSSDDTDKISLRTNGYSGADMATLCKEAAMGPLRSAIESGNIADIKEMDLRPVNFSDFDNALLEVKSSVSPDEIAHYIEFNELYGHGVAKV